MPRVRGAGDPAQAQERVDVLADAAGYLWEGPGGIVSLLAARALAGVRVRVLLADPDGDVANREAAGRSTMLASQCRVAVGHLRPLMAVSGVDVRLHDEVLHAEVIRGDHELLVIPRVTGHAIERVPGSAPTCQSRRAHGVGLSGLDFVRGDADPGC